MTHHASELLDQVLNLPERDRAEIATRLLESLDTATQSEIDDAWATEIESRCAAVDDGSMQTSNWDEVRARIERDVFGR
ncbi:MAG: addiction module protein [Thermoanaerobaculia bacterium]